MVGEKGGVEDREHDRRRAQAPCHCSFVALDEHSGFLCFPPRQERMISMRSPQSCAKSLANGGKSVTGLEALDPIIL